MTFLTNHFIAHFGANTTSIRRAPAEIYQILRAYSWPGNVRELKNVIQRASSWRKEPSSSRNYSSQNQRSEQFRIETNRRSHRSISV